MAQRPLKSLSSEAKRSEVKSSQVLLYCIQRNTWVPHINNNIYKKKRRIKSTRIRVSQHSITYKCHNHYLNGTYICITTYGNALCNKQYNTRNYDCHIIH